MTGRTRATRATRALSELVSRMARREALALMLVPDLDLRIDAPRPRLLFDARRCPWCPHGAPSARPPLRDVPVAESAAAVADAVAADPSLLVLTTLRCEEITARALLPIGLIWVTGRGHPPLSTRAAFWAEFSGAASLSPDDVLRGLTALDDRESWLDAFPTDGARPAGEHGRVLPVSTRITPADGPTEVAASRGGLHFLTPHVGALAERLNDVYLSVRSEAVREALEQSARWTLSR
ncbi:hypothetical protein AB0395_28535 [Streptosporangium sp. NPDC051023]|uniref:hypothetical protein n=1 Tax=Streptosporangium sp. NPDC051023 TaxID=3155410 RepID=UPI00344E1B2D